MKHVCVGQNETACAPGSECRPPGNDLYVGGLVAFKLGSEGSSQVFWDYFKGREPSSQVQPTHLDVSHLRIHLKQGFTKLKHLKKFSKPLYPLTNTKPHLTFEPQRSYGPKSNSKCVADLAQELRSLTPQSRTHSTPPPLVVQLPKDLCTIRVPF